MTIVKMTLRCSDCKEKHDVYTHHPTRTIKRKKFCDNCVEKHKNDNARVKRKIGKT